MILKVIIDIERMGDEIECIVKLVICNKLLSLDIIKISMLFIGECVVVMMWGIFDVFVW